MDVKTAVAVLVAQAQECQNSCAYITAQAVQAQNLANSENSIPEVNPQIKGIISSINANMTAMNAQSVLLQNAIDVVAGLVN